jgi:ubiquitin C-terminal hydrolase/serine/threonine protein kinase
MNICEKRTEDVVNQRIVEDFIFGKNFNPNAVSFLKKEIRFSINGTNYDFVVDKTIGAGSFGTVDKVIDKKHKVSLAIKYTNANDEKNISDALSKANCNVLQMRYIGKKDLKYVYIMELADGDLNSWLERKKKKKLKISINKILEIADGIRRQMGCIFFYDNNYVYSDIKLDNILFKCDNPNQLNKERFILGDLGSAVPTGNKYPTTFPAWDLRFDRTLKNNNHKMASLSWQLGILLLLFYNSYDIKDKLYWKNIGKQSESSILEIAKILDKHYGHGFGRYLDPDPNLRPSIFEPFIKVHNTKKTIPSGSSLKLSERTLKKMLVVKLKELAVKLGCKGNLKVKKEQLIELIIGCGKLKTKSPIKSPHKSLPKQASKLSERTLKKMLVVKLKELAVKLGCKGNLKVKKEQLIELIMKCGKLKTIKSAHKSLPKQSHLLTERTLKKMTVVKLKELATKLACKGNLKVKKEQLIELIIKCQKKISVLKSIHSHHAPPSSIKFTPGNLKKLRIVDLKEIAVKVGCKGKLNIKKDLLIQLIISCKFKKTPSPPKHQSTKKTSSRNSELPIGLLSNIGNSCYLDSVLLSLFTVQNDFVDRNILDTELTKRNISKLYCIPKGNPKIPEIDLYNRQQVQNELVNITKSIRGKRNVKQCTGLRGIIKSCPNPENFQDDRPKDAGDFLGYILNMFDTDVAVKQFDIYVTNNLNAKLEDIPKLDTNVDRTSSVVHTMFYHDMMNIEPNTPTRLLISRVEDSGELDPDNYYRGYKRLITVVTLVDAPYLIINLQRNNPVGDDTIKTKIMPSNSIIVGENILSLSAIVIHRGDRSGGHYTAYLKINDEWYYYNDMGPSIVKVGSYNKLLSSNPSPMKYGTLYFYS